ncbi:hypothetical protein D3C85_1165700 [compost metagenome]
MSRAPASVIGVASSNKVWPLTVISRSGKRKPCSSKASSNAGSANSSAMLSPAGSRPYRAINAGLASSTLPALSSASTGSVMAASNASSCKCRRWPGRMSTTVTACTPRTLNSASRSSSRTSGLRVGASM